MKNIINTESKLYLVEGIPGSGKTTTARKLKEELEGNGYKVHLYEEGMSHPADCAWQAFLTEQEYEEFKLKCFEIWETTNKSVSLVELEECLEEQVRREDGRVLLAYTKIKFPAMEYWSLVGSLTDKELCDGRSKLEDFKKIHITRWSNFAKNAENSKEINIFECAFLQNHIFELMGFYEKTDAEICDYLKELLDTVKGLKPAFVYLEPESVDKVIIQAASERKSPDPSRKDWIDEIADWVSNSHYGSHHGLKGIEGVIQFCEERMRIDMLVLKQLDRPVTYIKRN